MSAGRFLDDLLLLFERRILDLEIEHETIELGFGQRIRSFHLDRVLSCDDEERRIEGIGAPPDRDLALLHRLQERGLRFGGRAVDLVGEQEVGEDRPGKELELAAAGRRIFLDDIHAGDVRRHEVGCELDAAKFEVERARESVGHQRFAEPGHTEQKDMAAAKQADKHMIDDLFLADDHFGDLVANRLSGLAHASDNG